MSLTGRIIQRNGKDNFECYAAGTNGSLPVEVVPTAPVGRIIGMEWATPVSYEGQIVDGFVYQKAKTDGSDSASPPRADSVKVIVIEDVTNGGSYQKVLVGNSYSISDFLAAACAGCDPLPDVTVPEPFILLNADCAKDLPVIPECTYSGSIYVPAFTGSNNTYTATPLGFKADGTAIVFSPGTATGTSVALLAAAMQTAWASELGSGTFTADGNTIVFESTNGAKVSFSIAQSQV